TISYILSKYFYRIGYYVYTVEDYQSRIRGGHNFSLIRVSEKPILGIDNPFIDILIALNNETIELHKKEVKEEGYIICEEEIKVDFYPNILKVPLRKIALEVAKSKIVENTVVCGVLLGLTNGDEVEMEKIISEYFKPEDVDKNIKAMKAGYSFGIMSGKKCRDFPKKDKKTRIFLSGGEAIGFGAIVSGCKFLASYPMTPGTSVMNFLAEHELEYDIVVEQAEDEIAAINMAIGGFFAGARSMVTTSGGGFALMVEGLSLAGMTETPIVIHIGQRPGPATGLPTRTEQADLNFVIHAGHGEFPRYVTAPRDQKDAFYKTIKAFELSEKYQIPAIILSDQHLIDSKAVIDELSPSFEIQTYRIRGDKDYLRHKITEDGISPFAIPGESEGLVITDSDEHDEEGHLTEDLEIRKRMVEKRMKKLNSLYKEMEEPIYYGVEDPEVVLVGWGSTYGVIKEAVEDLVHDGYKLGYLHFSDVYPLPTKNLQKFRDKKLYTIEQNYQGQLAGLIRKEACIKIDKFITKYDGRPFYVENIIKEVKEKWDELRRV
ncbi:MAG: 2-oxoacid:acceptor oxidoreductase subunit alpha, partial [Dictyoglomus sp.]